MICGIGSLRAVGARGSSVEDVAVIGAVEAVDVAVGGRGTADVRGKGVVVTEDGVLTACVTEYGDGAGGGGCSYYSSGAAEEKHGEEE